MTAEDQIARPVAIVRVIHHHQSHQQQHQQQPQQQQQCQAPSNEPPLSLTRAPLRTLYYFGWSVATGLRDAAHFTATHPVTLYAALPVVVLYIIAKALGLLPTVTSLAEVCVHVCDSEEGQRVVVRVAGMMEAHTSMQGCEAGGREPAVDHSQAQAVEHTSLQCGQQQDKGTRMCTA